MITEEDIVKTLEQHASGGDFDAAWSRATQDAEPVRTTWWPRVAIALAAAAVLVVALNMGRPGASAPAVSVEDGADEADPENTITVLQRMSAVLTLPEPVQHMTADEPDVVELTVLSDRMVHILGRAEGEATVSVWTDGATEPSRYLVTVGPPKDPASGGAEDLLTMEPGESITLSSDEVPFVDVGPVPEEVATVEIVEGRVEIHANGPGVVDVVMVTSEQDLPIIYQLVVGPP